MDNMTDSDMVTYTDSNILIIFHLFFNLKYYYNCLSFVCVFSMLDSTVVHSTVMFSMVVDFTDKTSQLSYHVNF